MTIRTIDRVTVRDRMSFYAPGELGKTRRITPEGYLLCEGVAIARTGTQTYHVSELKPKDGGTPLEGNSDGQIIVERLPEEVFREETIASFEGKSITVEHPNDFVTPENFKEHEVGHMQHVRRGTDADDDLLLADFLIKDPSAIAYVNKDLPEVSCGYDSEYEQTEPGKAIQRQIVGNHGALVDRGRAGPRCAIKDHQPDLLQFTGDFFMAKPSFKARVTDRLNRIRIAFLAKDSAALEKELGTQDDESEGEETMDSRVKDALDWIDARKAKDAAEEKEKADCAEKEKKEAEDRAAKDALLSAETTGKIADLGKVYTGDALKEVFSRAEILAPGISLPTNDSVKTNGTLEALMTKALATADATEVGKECIKPFLLGQTLIAATKDSMALAGVFNGAAELMRQRNNSAAAATRLTSKDFGKKPPDNAELNRLARARWGSK